MKLFRKNLDANRKMCNFASKLGIKMYGLIPKLGIKTCRVAHRPNI